MPSILALLRRIARKARQRVPMPQLVRSVLERFAATPAPPVTAASKPAAAPVVEKQPSWELRTQAELVDHIVAYFHAGLRRDLPALVAAAQRIEREHAHHPAVPVNLADELAALASELESHMIKEETVLFPMLRTGARGGQLDMPIRMMERDHDDHADALDRIRQRATNLTPPADASAAWIDLYAGLARLERELHQHIYLENNILFARAAGERDG